MVTGLSEIYQYTLAVDEQADTSYSDMELRTMQDWIVKRQLAGVPGVAEVSSFGGHLKQYEVSIDPHQLQGYNITLSQVYNALQRNNRNTGGSYIEKTNTYYFIRGEGMVGSLEELDQVRSEEHPSELQSLMRISYAVFCLKQQNNTYNNTNTRLHTH